MKVYSGIRLIREPELSAKVSRSDGKILGLQEDTLLTGVALERISDLDQPAEDPHAEVSQSQASEESTATLAKYLLPAAKIILTHFPLAAWGRLFRISLTCAPGPGSLEAIVEILNKIGLHCHFLSCQDGVNLNQYAAASSESVQNFEIDPAGYDSSHLLSPSTYLILECAKDGLSTVDGVNPSSLYALHQTLIASLDDPTCIPKKDIRGKLQKVLKSATSIKELRVDWISPMETLNRLARWHPKEETSESAKPNLSRLLHLERARARKKVNVSIDPDNNRFNIPLTPWKRMIWPTRKRIPDRYSWKSKEILLSLGCIDSDEQTLTIDIFREPEGQRFSTPVIEFELLHAGGPQEALWWQWVFSLVGWAGGNILRCTTTGRLRGHWSGIRVTAIFLIDTDAQPQQNFGIGRLLDCFRALQGQEGQDIQAFNKEYVGSKDEKPGNFERLSFRSFKKDYDENAIALESTLRKISIWDPDHGGISRNYTEHFKPNPYSYTKPLVSEKYQKLYPQAESGVRTRKALSMRIVERLRAGQNIAIVGANRAGKTSVLNLVESNLSSATVGNVEQPNLQSLNQGNRTTLIPIRINAQLLPAQAVFPWILVELLKWSEEHSSEEHSGEPERDIPDSLLQVARQLRKTVRKKTNALMKDVDIAITLPFIRATIKNQSQTASDSTKGEGFLETPAGATVDTIGTDLLSKSLALGGDQSLNLMRRTLELLQETLVTALTSAKQSNDEGLANTDVRIVILVDEIGRLSGGGFSQILHGWRHVIESKQFDSLQWLISTTRPIRHSPDLSPLTNVFMEYNVGSLRKKEARRLIEASAIADPDEPEKITPVLSYHAGVFVASFTSRLPYFMQVVLYHIYDRSTRTVLPVIGRRVCSEIIMKDVLEEVSEFMEFQWNQVPSEKRNLVKTSILRELPDGDPLQVLSNLEEGRCQESQFSGGVRKAMLRAGLKGDDDPYIVSPIVAYWILTSGPGHATRDQPDSAD